MANPIGTLIAEALSDKLSPLDAAALASELDAMQRITAKVGGREAKFDRIEAVSGHFSTLPHEFGWLGSDSNGAQTIPKDVFTPVDSMDDFTIFGISQGLKLDSDGEYIEIGTETPGDSVYLINATIKWASNSTGFRAMRYAFYDPVTTTWGNEFETMSIAANPSTVTIVSGPLIYSTKVNPQYRRIRVEVLQNSGGDLAIDIPQLMVVRLR